MGNQHPIEKTGMQGEPVFLNVYDLTDRQMPGFGIYHSGVQVYDTEHMFGAQDTLLTGVTSHRPRNVPNAKFKEQVLIGHTQLSRAEVRTELAALSKEFPGNSYHTTNRNCNHFADTLCRKLCGQGIPAWVNRAAKVGGLLGVSNLQQKHDATSNVASGPVSTYTDKQYDLFKLIDTSSMECLNEDTVDNLFSIMVEKPKKGAMLKSDADEQLLISLAFQQHVKLSALVLQGLSDGTAPSLLRLYVNQLHVDFDTVERMTPAQEIVVPQQAVTIGASIPLNQAKFSRVTRVTLFIVKNIGDKEHTCVTRLQWIGAPLLTTRISELRAVETQPPLTD